MTYDRASSVYSIHRVIQCVEESKIPSVETVREVSPESDIKNPDLCKTKKTVSKGKANKNISDPKAMPKLKELALPKKNWSGKHFLHTSTIHEN